MEKISLFFPICFRNENNGFLQYLGCGNGGGCGGSDGCGGGG